MRARDEARVELHLEGLPGPTHNYGGLAPGNVASERHRGAVAYPREAALQSLRLMRWMVQAGIPNAILPPLPRPDLAFLQRLGFGGATPTPTLTLAAAAAEPAMLTRAYATASMWTANAATVAASAETRDGRVHLVTANMVTQLHRALEAAYTDRLLRRVFADARYFAVHAPLPSHPLLGDEGAANHTRLVGDDGLPYHLFVYGQAETGPRPTRHPARQTLAASQAVARLLQLDPARTLFVQQHPDAIDAGVFHNDVICVGSETLLLVHQGAFVDQQAVLTTLREHVPGLFIWEVDAADVSLTQAVQTYLFNSRLLRLPDGRWHLAAPSACESEPAVAQQLAAAVADAHHPLAAVSYHDLRQSMQNGGGPACLRLRVPLTSDELAVVHPGVRLHDAKIDALEAWVRRHYRETLTPADLADVALAEEAAAAHAALWELLQLG